LPTLLARQCHSVGVGDVEGAQQAEQLQQDEIWN